jgi:hypothetical protein
MLVMVTGVVPGFETVTSCKVPATFQPIDVGLTVTALTDPKVLPDSDTKFGELAALLTI